MRKEDFFEALGEFDDNIMKEAKTTMKKKLNWKVSGTMVACLCFVAMAAFIIPNTFTSTSGNNQQLDVGNENFPLDSDFNGYDQIADIAPMVYVNHTLYQIVSNQPNMIGKEDEFSYLGKILSKVTSWQKPTEDFQANDDIIGSKIYQYEEDVVVEINGQYWLYEMLDVDYMTNDDGTYTCRNNIFKYKIEVSGIDGESQVTFIVLTNNTETNFEDIAYSLRKAEMSTEIPEFVILGWY